MATTIPASFNAFRSKLQITSLQQGTVSTRQQSVRDAVARRLSVETSFVTGSYRRNTMIAPLKEADIDVFVVLDPKYYRSDGYASLLDRTRSVLLETYTRSPKISRNGQAVTITFSDFVVDVVPSFYRRGGGYLIPSTTEKRWLPTNPQTHVTFISNANAQHSGDLVPLIKMIKAWNREANYPLRSFYLELLIEKVLRGVTISNFSSGCRYVFDKGRDAVRYVIDDPAGLGSSIRGLQNATTVAAAVSRFETALSRAKNAESFAQAGRVSDAVAEWTKIFGSEFPGYG